MTPSVERATVFFYFIFVFDFALISFVLFFFKEKKKVLSFDIIVDFHDKNGVVLVLVLAEICYGVVSEGEASIPCELSSGAERRRRMEIRRIKIVDVAPSEDENGRKRKNLQAYGASFSLNCENAVENCASDEDGKKRTVKHKNGRLKTKGTIVKSNSTPSLLIPEIDSELHPKFGVASVCGRRRDMEDAVAFHPSFHRQGQDSGAIGFHYFGVYDGHGCSHVRVSKILKLKIDVLLVFFFIYEEIEYAFGGFGYCLLGGDEVQRAVT